MGDMTLLSYTLTPGRGTSSLVSTSVRRAHIPIPNTSFTDQDVLPAAPPSSEGVSLSPPFVLSISVSATGVLAASTADGRVWLGGGGEKRPDSKKKRSRKWEGLKEDEGVWLQVADGPVVAW